MAIRVDISNPETNIDDVREIVLESTDEETREALYETFKYGLNQQDTIDEKHLEKLVEFGDEKDFPQSADSVEELRESLENQREQIASVGRLADDMSAMADVLYYIYLGEGREDATRVQKKAISSDVDMGFTIPVR